MTCNKCGQQTPRSGKCKRCAQMDRREEELQSGQSSSGPLLVYECSNCGHRYEREGLESCPECDAERARCLGRAEEVSA